MDVSAPHLSQIYGRYGVMRGGTGGYGEQCAAFPVEVGAVREDVGGYKEIRGVVAPFADI